MLPGIESGDFELFLISEELHKYNTLILTSGVPSYPWFAAHGSKFIRTTPHTARAGTMMVKIAL